MPVVTVQALNNPNHPVTREWFCEIPVYEVRPGDLIVFGGHVGIIDSVLSQLDEHGNNVYYGDMYHSAPARYDVRYEDSVVTDGPRQSRWVYDYEPDEQYDVFYYGDEVPVTRFLRIRFLPYQCLPTGWETPAGSGSSCEPGPCNWPPKPEEAGPEITIDPLVIALTDAGITTVSQDEGVFFDFDANGFHELSGWIGAGSGLLMLDLNGNGELDDGSELFGDFTMMPTGENAGNGFHALSQYDDNQDGRIDANDAIWSQLGVYYDSEYYTPQSAGGG
jgi:hypothetical protein